MDAAAVVVTKPAKWTGDWSSDWSNKANWSPPVLPTATSEVQIPKTDRQPVLSRNISVNKITIAQGAALTLSGWSLSVGKMVNHGKVLLRCTETVTVQEWDTAGTWEFTHFSQTGKESCPIPKTIPYDDLTLNAQKGGGSGRFVLLAALDIPGMLLVQKGMLDLAGYDVHAKSITNNDTVAMQGSEDVEVAEGKVIKNSDRSQWVLLGRPNQLPDAFTLRLRHFSNLTIRPTDVKDTFLLSQGSLVDGTLSVLRGSVTLAPTATLAVEGITLNGGDMMVNGLITVSGSTLVDKGTLTLLGPGRGTQTMRDLTVRGGMVSAGSGTAEMRITSQMRLLSGSFIAPRLLTVSGPLVQTRGTIDPRVSTIVLDGFHQSMSGVWMFNNLRKETARTDTLVLGTGTILSVRGTLTLRATGTSYLILQSAKSGAPWALDARGQRVLERLDVQDANAINRDPMRCLNCRDSGGNKNWFFTH